MIQDFAPKSTLYFLTGMVWGGARIGLVAHATNLEAECVLYCVLTGMVGRGVSMGSALFLVGRRSPGGGSVYS
eukprot:5289029-Pyramimonas_sp.AAC.1